MLLAIPVRQLARKLSPFVRLVGTVTKTAMLVWTWRQTPYGSQYRKNLPAAAAAYMSSWVLAVAIEMYGYCMDWIPTIADRTGPLYLQIVDALASDIVRGRLSRGQVLPTHRALAKALRIDL